MKLSIAIITMNRSEQLRCALQSCTACHLPPDTHFVIIDNGSTDNTQTVVESFFKQFPYKYYYEHLPKNLGAGKGRNIAFQHSEGDYVYFLDDDAYIDVSANNDFFEKAIAILDERKEIITITTQIYDLSWGKNRVNSSRIKLYEGIYSCFMVCGGSHFLRSSFYKGKNPYFENKYGYEELKPSLRAFDAEKQNAFVPSLLAIHNPQVNKWDFSDRKNSEILIAEIANQRAIKGMVYSTWVFPIVCLAYNLRCIKYLSFEQKKIADNVVSTLTTQYNFGERIRLRTVLHLLKDFGISIF